jgi:hypothetical protein
VRGRGAAAAPLRNDYPSGLPSMIFQITFPLHGEEIFFLRVAFLARRGDVPAGGLSPPNEGDDMVQGQQGGGEFFSAVMADPAGQALLPPAGFAQSPGLFFFFPDFPFAYLDDEGIRHAFPAGEASGFTAFFRPMVESWPPPESFPEGGPARPERRVKIPPA